jgi:uncharacterized membrane protein YkoI
MRGIMGWLGLSIMAALVLLTTLAQADDKNAKDSKDKKDKKVALDKVPPKVMDAVKGRFPGAKPTSVEKEMEDGKVVYDIELTHKGRKYEMDIEQDGTILEIEKEIFAKNWPEAVTKALKAKYPDATIKEVMEVNKVKGKKETPVHYEVTLTTADKKEMEVIVSLDGKSIKKEGEDKEKSKDKK